MIEIDEKACVHSIVATDNILDEFAEESILIVALLETFCRARGDLGEEC